MFQFLLLITFFFLLFNLSRLERNTNKTDNKKLVEFTFSIKTNKNQHQFLKRKYSDSFFSHLKYYIMQNPVNSTGSVLKQNSLSICNFACSKVLISKCLAFVSLRCYEVIWNWPITLQTKLLLKLNSQHCIYDESWYIFSECSRAGI